MIKNISIISVLSLQGELDPSIFGEMQRAAKLLSAVYTDCTGTAFDVTITTQLDNITTDTQVSYYTSPKGDFTLPKPPGLHWLLDN